MDKLKKREINKGKKSRKIINIENQDLLKKECEVIVNSIGPDVGFNGFIAKAIVKKCGKSIIKDAGKDAKRKFHKAAIPFGEFVTTEAGKSDDHQYIIHAVCPYFEDFKGNEDEAEKKLTKLIYNIFEFCGVKGINTLALPPVGSGICGYPTKTCSKAYFNGIMDYLEDCDLKTSLESATICIIESDKTVEFKNEWEKRKNERFPGGELDVSSQSSEDEKKSDDDIDDEDDDADYVGRYSKNQKLGKPLNTGKKAFKQDTSSDDSFDKPKGSVLKSIPNKGKKKADSSSDSDNKKPSKPIKKKFSDESSDDEPPKASKKKPASKLKIDDSSSDEDAKKTAVKKKPSVARKLCDSESDDEPKSKKMKKKVSSDTDSEDDKPSKPVVKASVKDKKKVKGSSSSSESSDDDRKKKPIKASVKQSMKKQKKDVSSSSDSDSDDIKKKPTNKAISQSKVKKKPNKDDSSSDSDTD